MSSYRVGRGIADITGEAFGCGMLGYGKASQQTDGIHLRLRSRAFVIEDTRSDSRVLIVVNELPLMFDSVHREVLKRLSLAYAGRYSAQNVMLTATHTHCGPGGYGHHLLYNMTTRGFRQRTFDAIVDGITEAIDRAHTDLAPATLTLARAAIDDASTNRSKAAFDLNPSADRSVFPDAIDPENTVLAIERSGGVVGAISWFPTHGTSMTNKNTLISSDNKGYAAYHWEHLVAGVDYRAGEAPALVTAFAQSNAGDMSPNLNGRPGSGPTEDEFENTRIIGTRQYEATTAALASSGRAAVTGPVDSRVTFVDLSDVTVKPTAATDGRPHRTGGPVAGAPAFAGTDEGPGFAGFRQGRNPWWDGLSRLAYAASPRLRDTHAPKGMVLPGGLLNRLAPFVQEQVPVQLLRVGDLYLVGVPGEVTIVAGLRLRRTVAEVVGTDLPNVVVAGYCNAYIHYVTTPEEYTAQRYEGGSTIFGRWELPALQQVVAELSRAMRDGEAVALGPVPMDPRPRRLRRASGRGTRSDVDRPPAGRDFGDILSDVGQTYRQAEVVSASFVGVDPRNDPRRGGTFLEVQRRERDGTWRTVADDGDWSTTCRWSRIGRRSFRVTVTWRSEGEPGSYRIRYLATAARGSLRVEVAAESAIFSLTNLPERSDEDAQSASSPG